MAHHVLILGGTTEARQLAGRLIERGGLKITLSLAGRTREPAAQPVPVRTGGFGGAEGLARYLAQEHIRLLIDATHPYAAQISRNAAGAAKLANVPILALRRPPWLPVAGDRWTEVASLGEAAERLGNAPHRVFLALGRQDVRVFSTAPQHFYLIRSVDPIEPPLDVPHATYLTARGPFDEESERALLQSYGIDAIVAKNSGGDATYAKIVAARALGIEVIVIRRPELPDVPTAETVDEAEAGAAHVLASAKRGE